MFDVSWRMFGTSVRVSIGFWIFTAIFGMMMGIGQDPSWSFLPLWVGCSFLTTMVHELGHVAAGRMFGIPGAIHLSAMGGGAVGEYDRAERWQRIAIAAAGPIAGLSLYAAVYFAAPTVVARLSAMGQWAETAFYAVLFVAFMTLFWNLMNLLPILPMDGGRITQGLLGYVLGRRDFVVAAVISAAVAFAIAGYSYYKFRHPDAAYVAAVFKPLYPLSLRESRFAKLDPEPIFLGIMYVIFGILNLVAAFRKPANAGA